MKFYENVLTPDEMEAYQAMISQEECERLRILYAQHQITERRIMEEIKAIKDGAEMITLRTISQAVPTGKKTETGSDKVKVVRVSQKQETRKELLRNFTDALTRVRAEMRRIADSLFQEKIQYAKLDIELLRLEALQPLSADEQGGSNLIEALNANAADFFPEYIETNEKESKDEPVDKDDSKTGN
jgi:hypothetical protein